MKRFLLAAILASAPTVLGAQTATVPVTVPQASAAFTTPVDDFYARRGGNPIWLKDDASRSAAVAFATLLRSGDLYGLGDGPGLAARVEAAVAANDEKTIAQAWVTFVQAIEAPVEGVSFGDASLERKTESAGAILNAAANAPSLGDYVTRTAAVNPFFATLRDLAVKDGATTDPHVRATLNRLRLVPSSGRLILVDAANAQLMMVEDGRVVDSMKVIVGKPAYPTPLLAGKIYYVTFNPYWHIPHDVAQRKVAPVVLKRGVSYLKAARYQTVAAFGKNEDPIDPTTIDWKGVADGSVQVNIRQLNGPNNMMGAMKFGFANDYGVYLHDTPHKDLFAKAKRNLSLGCVRLEHPERLAQWLLGRDPTPPGDGVEQHVPVEGMPIYISYMTARPDGDKIQFADDVYGLDSGRPVEVAKASAGDSDAAGQ